MKREERGRGTRLEKMTEVVLGHWGGGGVVGGIRSSSSHVKLLAKVNIAKHSLSSFLVWKCRMRMPF